MLFRDADTVVILIDIDDPLTYDKEFVRTVRYSPFSAGGTSINEANRNSIRDMSEDDDDDIFANKFVIEIFPDKFGDFISYIMANENSQRILIFREYSNGIPGEDEEDEDEDFEDGAIVAVFELKSGPPLKSKTSINFNQEDDFNEEESEDGAIDANSVDHGKDVKILSPKARSIEDLMESLANSGTVVAPSTETLQ